MKQRNNQMQMLDDAILLLESKREKDFDDLKTQFYKTTESFKPINIFNQTVKDFRDLPEVKTNLLETILSISGGYFSKKILVGKSNSLVKKIFGYVLQYAVTNFISKKVSSENEL